MTEKKEERCILDIKVQDKMRAMLDAGTNLDRDRARVLALIKVLPEFIKELMNNESKKETKKSKTKL